MYSQKACVCSLAGTPACEHCVNNSPTFNEVYIKNFIKKSTPTFTIIDYPKDNDVLLKYIELLKERVEALEKEKKKEEQEKVQENDIDIFIKVCEKLLSRLVKE